MRNWKIVSLIVMVVAVILGGIYWHQKQGDSGGVNQNGKAGTVTVEEEKENTKDSISTEQEENKKTNKERIIIEDTNYDEIDNNPYAWWFQRNDRHEPSGCQRDFDIHEFDGYYVVPTCEKRIFFTFDCGYENGYTSDILDILKKEKVPAAFFLTQTFIRDNIDLVKRMKEEGHLVCNHTVHHPSMPQINIEKQREEILACERYMMEATGYEMDLFFRPPKGEYSKRTLQLAKDLGYKTIFWSMAYLDYDVNNQPSREHVVEHFNKYHHSGAIPLLHNVSKANRDALSEVISNLKKEGYQFASFYDINEQ